MDFSDEEQRETYWSTVVDEDEWREDTQQNQNGDQNFHTNSATRGARVTRATRSARARGTRGTRARGTRASRGTRETSATSNEPSGWKNETFVPPPATFDDSEAGPTADVDADPLACFDLLFPQTLIDLISEESKKYAKQNKFDLNTNPNEIKALFGILIIMGIVRMKSTDDYFSEHPLLNFTSIKDIITRQRLRELLRYAHANDNLKMKKRNEPGYDPLYKVRPIMDTLNATFQKNWNPFSHMTIDEGMVPSKSSKSGFRIYMKNKPTKWGYKLWKMVDKAKYLYHFQIYTGLKGSNGARVPDLGPSIIRTLTSNLPEGRTYHIFADNFFTSIPIVNELQQKKMFFTGTIKNGRVGLPSAHQWIELEKNESQSFTKDRISTTRWQDSSIVRRKKEKEKKKKKKRKKKKRKKKKRNKKNAPFFIKKGREDVKTSINQCETLTGFANMFTFKIWVSFFIQNLPPFEKRKDENILLIMDGYSSHTNDFEAIDLLEKKDKSLLFLPPLPQVLHQQLLQI